MIELLKYLANNLGPEDLLHLAQFLSKNPQIIDEKTLLEIINEVDGYEMHRIADTQYDDQFSYSISVFARKHNGRLE